MKIYYNSDSVNICTNDNSVFAHRNVSITHEERVKIKNAVMETILDKDVKSLSKIEREYWALYRRGIKNEDIARQLKISQTYCRQLKFRVVKKIEKIAFNLKKRLE